MPFISFPSTVKKTSYHVKPNISGNMTAIESEP